MSDNRFTPGPTANSVRAADGRVLTVPADWILLPPGDAALTRRAKAAGEHWVVQERRGRKVFSCGIWTSAATVERIRADLEAERSTESFAKKKQSDARRREKAAGEHWVVQERRGRKVFSCGIWTSAATVERIRADLEAERSTESFAKKKQSDARRREKAQAEYVEDFHGAVVTFLAFHPVHAELADRLARAVTDHATPVGSGTVARTQRIPVERRAEAAVIAWMRHQTTGYDGMTIPRVSGMRREIRRTLAQRSKQLLERYRRGDPIGDECPLKKALPK